MGKYPKAGNTKNMINIFEKITDEKNRIANGLRTEKGRQKMSSFAKGDNVNQ